MKNVLRISKVLIHLWGQKDITIMRNQINKINKLSPLHREYLEYKIYMSLGLIGVLLIIINNLSK